MEVLFETAIILLLLLVYGMPTGDFVNDVTDDVSSLDAEACHSLVGWLDFYHKVQARALRGGQAQQQHSMHTTLLGGDTVECGEQRVIANWGLGLRFGVWG